MPKEEMRSRLQLDARVFDAMLQGFAARGIVSDLGNSLALAGWTIELNVDEQRRAETYVAALEATPDAPPAPGDFGLNAELLAAMEERGLVVRLAENVVFGAGHLERVKAETLRLIDAHGTLTLAQFRDHFGSSRKYAQAVLEYFDQQRVTRRVGDARVRGGG
jgi:selenocysteine-specific elongation factor